MCGALTSGCGRATVVDAFSRNYTVLLPEGAVADDRSDQHEFHLPDIDGRYAERLVLEDAIGLLRSSS